MSDPMVLATQQWLNRIYGNRTGFGSVSEDGETGWNTINALIRALQIELGITATVNNFGPGTQSRFIARWPNGVQEQAPGAMDASNVYGIIQGALWCKGYSTGSSEITSHFFAGTGSGIRQMKADAGIAGDSSVDLDVMMSLLSMKQFRLLSSYGGTRAIRVAQQSINRDYRDYTGIVPTDGLYGREMNMALIQVLQAIEGYTPEAATGNFGDGTRSKLVTISSANASSHLDWVWLAGVALVCNRVAPQVLTSWSDAFADHVNQFQERYGLPVSGVVDTTTWMSLLTSKGNPDRACTACDTRFEVTGGLLSNLKADGYEIVGRYLSEPNQDHTRPEDYFKAIRPGELQRIVNGGMKYFPIYQEYSTALRHFTPTNGARHAEEAQNAAKRLGVPPTVIYFAVDFDATDPEVNVHILPYFQAIKSNLGGGYGVGIYASRNICTRVIDAGHAVSAFVSDMSTGFSGNLGFPIPTSWNYDQFAEISGYRGSWDLDRVAYSGRVPACASVLPQTPFPTPDPDPQTPANDPLLQWTISTENSCLQELSGLMNPAAPYRGLTGGFILEWLRKPEYWGDKYFGMWRIYTPELPIPAELESARILCASKCAEQPTIKGTLPRRDVAHMAATTLGYLTWGVTEDHSNYGLGDLGGWTLDLLQIWGNYIRESSNTDLANWLHQHLGHVSDGQGFGYDDVLADADAWLLARHMSNHPSGTSLSEAMSDAFAASENNRIKRFYHDRFGASADNLVSAFQGIVNGIDIGGFDELNFGKDELKNASGADRLPTRDEADTLGRAYAAFLASPHK